MPTVTVRLTAEELAWLDTYAASNRAGYANRSEYLRALLHHEHNKRNGLPPDRTRIDTAFRLGRPKHHDLPTTKKT
jgi:Arc/MetJ-type ribon-helix-helix transcriptional regulator